MKLEIGKRYMTRDGRVSSAVELRKKPTDGIPFVTVIPNDIPTRIYNEDGTHAFNDKALDLVSEYTESVNVMTKGNSIYIEGAKKFDCCVPDYAYMLAGYPANGARKGVITFEPEPEPEPLKLEAGKRYVKNNGGVTAPLCDYSPLFPEQDKSCFLDRDTMSAYTADGRHWAIQFSDDKSPAPFDISHPYEA